MEEVLLTIFTGMLTGLSSGMFGIGGSVVATPILKLALGIPAIIALATPIPAAIPSAASGSYMYYKNNLINFKLAGSVLITAIPFSWLGSWTTQYVDGTLLIVAKALFLAFLGLKFFISSWLFKSKDENTEIKIITSLLTGVVAGYVAGILAVGGGIVLVTAFVKFNKIKMKEAVATSLVCVFILAIVNSIKQYDLGHIDINITLILAATVIPFSMLGAKIAVSLRNQTLERAFGVAMIIFAIIFIITQIV
jgi:uncharacterized protein